MSLRSLNWYRLQQDVIVAFVVAKDRYSSTDFAVAFDDPSRSQVFVVSQGQLRHSDADSRPETAEKSSALDAWASGDAGEADSARSGPSDPLSQLSSKRRRSSERNIGGREPGPANLRGYYVFSVFAATEKGDLSLYLQGEEIGTLTAGERANIGAFDLLKAAASFDAAERIEYLFVLINWVAPYFKLNGNKALLADLRAIMQFLQTAEPSRAVPIRLDDGFYTLRLPKLSPLSAARDTKFFLITEQTLRPLVVTPASSNHGRDQDVMLEVPQIMRGQPVELLQLDKKQHRRWRLDFENSKGVDDLFLRLQNDAEGYGEFLLKGFKRHLAQRDKIKALAQRIVISQSWHAEGCPPSSAPLAGNLELAIPLPDGGLLVRGWLFDPLNLVEDWQFESQTGDRLSGADHLHFYRRRDLADLTDLAAHPCYQAQADYGFVARIPGPCERLAGVAWQLRLGLKGGGGLLLKAPRPSLNPVLNRAQALALVAHQNLTPELLREVLVPASRQLHRLCLPDGDARVKSITCYGRKAPSKPLYSVVIPLYRVLDYFRHQLAAFYVDPDFKQAEIIAVLDSPDQEPEFKHLLTGLEMIYDLPVKLVVHRGNYGYAPAINSGAAHAKGRWLVLLNSDVLPRQAGWLSGLAGAAKRKGVGLVGPKLLFEDDSLQHAGLYFGKDHHNTWLNRHRFKGYPADFPGATQSCEVPGVTGACMFLARQLYQRLGGTSEDYIIGDYEDSDFCLTVREAGKSVWYAADVELYHFERRSIRTNQSYAKTNACQVNQTIHHARWEKEIAILQKRFARLLPDTVSMGEK